MLKSHNYEQGTPSEQWLGRGGMRQTGIHTPVLPPSFTLIQPPGWHITFDTLRQVSFLCHSVFFYSFNFLVRPFDVIFSAAIFYVFRL